MIECANVVAVEGPDGSGKTTQAELLTERLAEQGYDVACVQPAYVLLNALPFVKEPGISPREERYDTSRSRVRTLVLAPLGIAYAVISVLYLAVTYRSTILVCDRYFYQFFFDLLGGVGVTVARFFPRPSVTVLLIGDENLLQDRMDEFDRSAHDGYHSSTLEFYEEIASECDVVRIDAGATEGNINDRILGVVNDNGITDA